MNRRDDVYNARPYRKALELYRQDPPTCQICGEPTTAATVSVDHIVPVSRWVAGTPAKVISGWSNLRPVHRRCNLSRGNRPGARPALAPSRDARY